MSPAATSFAASQGRVVIDALVATIDDNAAMLSDIDGAIGDGDHGINMRKGFLMARDELPRAVDLSTGLATLGDALLTRIGGAMGPLYGSLFTEMGEACLGLERIDAASVRPHAGRRARGGRGPGRGSRRRQDPARYARPGWRGLPGVTGRGRRLRGGAGGHGRGGRAGKESTRDMVARVGRASRLGERSRGVLDAGATSCWLLLAALRSFDGRIARRRGDLSRIVAEADQAGRSRLPEADRRPRSGADDGLDDARIRAVRWKASTPSSSGTARLTMRSTGTAPSAMSSMARTTAARVTPTLAWMVSWFQTTLNSSISTTRPTLPSQTIWPPGADGVHRGGDRGGRADGLHGHVDALAAGCRVDLGGSVFRRVGSRAIVAPMASASSRRAACGSRTTRCRGRWSAITAMESRPMGPPPMTTAQSPASTLARARPLTTTASGSMSAAWRKLTSSGMGTAVRALMRTRSANEPGRSAP